MPRKVLLIAKDFPPCASAGVQRTLKFYEHLPELGWDVRVLTVNEDAHERLDYDQTNSVFDGDIIKAKSFNTAKHLSIKGKYFNFMAIPDRWWTWRIDAVKKGKQLISDWQPDIIWSTYPVATAHTIAYKLSKWANTPWIADFRDPMQFRYDKNYENYNWLLKRIEAKVFSDANAIVLNTSKAAELYAAAYPNVKLNKLSVINNGFDEEAFAHFEKRPTTDLKKLTFLHSGNLYGNVRNPALLFQAISLLKQKGLIHSNNFELVFRGDFGTDAIKQQLRELGIEELVQFKPNIGYIESLKEMFDADILVIIQSPLFSFQIPGKAFEYLRSNKPILALTNHAGATAELLNKETACFCVENIDEMINALQEILINQYEVTRDVKKHSRQYKSKQLVDLMNSIVE